MEKKVSTCSTLVLLIAMMNGAASTWSTVSHMSLSDDSGSGDDTISPYASQQQEHASPTVIPTPVSSVGLKTFPSTASLVAFSTSTSSEDLPLTPSTSYQNIISSLFAASSSVLILLSVIPSTTIIPAMSQSVSSAASALLSSFPTSLSSVVFPSSALAPTPTPNPTFTQALTDTPSVAPSLLPSPIEVLVTILPSDPTTTTNLTPMPMLDEGSDASVPLPVLIAVPIGAVVLISMLFVLIVICCMRYRRRRKYTISSKNNRLSDYAPRSVTPVVPDVESNTDSKKRTSKSEEVAVDTLAMEFPDTPKYGSNEDIPALIILNPVKPHVEPVSNSLWSRTLPTRQKVRKNTCSESDVPDGLDSSVLKPAKSTSAIDTLTLSTEMTNKSIDDGTSMDLLLPEAKRKTSARKVDRNDYDHLLSEEELLLELEVDGDPSTLGSTGYVFLEPASSSSEKKPKGSSAPDDRDVDPEAKKDLQPSSMPIPIRPPQHLLPTEFSTATIERESIYDTPRSAGIDTFTPKESKQSTSSGSCSSARDIASSIETHSYYDVPKSSLLAYREEAAKQLGFSVQPNTSGVAQEASLVRLSSTQECYYDSLGSKADSQRSHSPPYYDIPKLLLQTKNRGQKLDSSEGDLVKETSVDVLESSDEHVYCVPPDVAVNNLKLHKSRVEVSKTDDTKAVNTSARKPVPKKRKKNEDSPHDSVVPAPRKVAGLSSISSSQEELLDKPEQKNDIAASLVPQASRRTKKPTKDGSGSVTSSQEDLLDMPELRSDTNASAVPPPRLVKKAVSSSSSTSESQEKLPDIPEAKSSTNTKVEPAPRPVKKSTSNNSGFSTSSQEKLLDKPQPKNDIATSPVPEASRRTKKPTKDGSDSVTSSRAELLDGPESKSDTNANAVPAPRPVKKAVSNSSSTSQEKFPDKLEAKSNTNTKVEPAPRPVKKSTSNNSGFITSSQEKLLNGPEKEGSTRSVKKSVSNSSGFGTKPESKDVVNAGIPTSIPDKTLATSDSITSSQEKLLDKSESMSDISAVAVPVARPAKLPMLNDLPGSGATKQLLRELKSLSGTTASSVPKPVLKKFTKTSPSNEQEQQIARDTSPSTPRRPLAWKPAVASPISISEKTLKDQGAKNSTTNIQPAAPAVSTKPAKKIKTSSGSVTTSTENLLQAPELKNANGANTSSPVRSSKPTVKKHTRGKSSSDIVATPDPMVAKEPEAKGDGANVAPAPKPVVAKKPALLARTASLEELLSKSNDSVARPASPKPAVGKKPATQAKISSSSTTGSFEDLLSQPESRNNRAAPLRPAIAKKPANKGLATKKSTSSVSSSTEDLLSTPESKKLPGVTFNGNGQESDPTCDSPSQDLVKRLDVSTGAGDKLKQNSKPKPKIIPRSGSRHAIVQEQDEATNSNSYLPSPSTDAPVRLPVIPTRPTQRPPPRPQRPDLKPPINA